MIDTLIKEVDTVMTEAETNEKLNQEDGVARLGGHHQHFERR